MKTGNYCHFIGIVKKTPRLKYTDTGTPRIQFTIQMKSIYKIKKTGKFMSENNFANIACIGPMAEDVAERITSGTWVSAVCSLRTPIVSGGGFRVFFDLKYFDIIRLPGQYVDRYDKKTTDDI